MHKPQAYFPSMSFNIILPSMTTSSKSSLILGLQANILSHFSSSRELYLLTIFLDFISLVTVSE